MTSDCGPYSRYTLPNYNTLCVGYNGRTSGCNGDSGGPLICESGKSKNFWNDTNYLVFSTGISNYHLNSGQNTDHFVLAGVASWASTKCKTNAPTGYASVSHARPWIRKIANVWFHSSIYRNIRLFLILFCTVMFSNKLKNIYILKFILAI